MRGRLIRLPRPMPAGVAGRSDSPPVGPARTLLERRFWAKVRVTDGCWLWTGQRDAQGYGRVTIAGHRIGAHRIAWLLTEGPIPSELTIDHRCEVKACVNRAHLQLVSRADNVRLAYLRRHGERSYRYHGGRLDKTRCVNGHAFTPENTYVWPDGRRRRCLTCHAAQHRRARARARLGAPHPTPRSEA